MEDITIIVDDLTEEVILGNSTAVGEAPVDGKQYARKNSDWEQVTIEDLPLLNVTGKTTTADLDITNLQINTLSETVLVLNEIPNIDLIPDGGFNDSGEWSQPSGWNVSGGVAVKTAGLKNELATVSSVGILQNKTYTVTWTLSNRTGGAFIVLLGGSNSGTSRSSNGTYVEIISTPLASDGKFYIQGTSGNSAGTIDNVSVVEVTTPSSEVQKRILGDLAFKDDSEITISLSGSTQLNSGAVSGQLWVAIGHATLPDGVIMQGI